jgi:hypothetical protein
LIKTNAARYKNGLHERLRPAIHCFRYVALPERQHPSGRALPRILFPSGALPSAQRLRKPLRNMKLFALANLPRHFAAV